MSLVASARNSTRLLVYSLISVLVVAFGSLGTFIASFVSPEFALVGLLLGSVLGAFLCVHESTIVGCLAGMVLGLSVSPLVYYLLDFETTYMVVFVLSLLGAFLGEPLAHFWREAEGEDSEDLEGGAGA